MAKLIEGEGLEQDYFSPAVEPQKDVLPFIKNPGLKEAYERYSKHYAGLATPARVADLENRLTEIGKIHTSLPKDQAMALGYLTTIYAIENLAENGRVKIDNGDFLKPLGLANARYLFAGAYRFDVETIKLEGEDAFYEMEDCRFEELEAIDGFGTGAKKVKITRIKGLGEDILSKSEDVTVGHVYGEVASFASESTNVLLETVGAEGTKLGFKSQGMEINSIKGDLDRCLEESQGARVKKVVEVGDNFGFWSKDMVVDQVKEAGDQFGMKAENMRVDSIEEGARQCMDSSRDSFVREVVEVTDYFGAGSTNLVVESVGRSGENFGDQSKELKVGMVEVTGDDCAKESTGFRVKYIGEAGINFGQNSEELFVEELARIVLDGFLENSNGATIHKVVDDEVEIGPGATDYLVIDYNGRVFTDKPYDEIKETLAQVTGYSLSKDSISLLGGFDEPGAGEMLDDLAADLLGVVDDIDDPLDLLGEFEDPDRAEIDEIKPKVEDML